MNLFASKFPEPPRMATGSIDLKQQQEQSLKLISNEFGIKFTKMNVEKQLSEVSMRPNSSSLSKSNAATTANSSAVGGNKRSMTPSFENSLGLSAISQAAHPNSFA